MTKLNGKTGKRVEWKDREERGTLQNLNGLVPEFVGKTHINVSNNIVEGFERIQTHCRCGLSLQLTRVDSAPLRDVFFICSDVYVQPIRTTALRTFHRAAVQAREQTREIRPKGSDNCQNDGRQLHECRVLALSSYGGYITTASIERYFARYSHEPIDEPMIELIVLSG